MRYPHSSLARILRPDGAAGFPTSIAAFAIMTLALGYFRPTLSQERRPSPPIITEQNVHREFAYVPMKDGVRLAYVLWRPAQKGRFPTLVEYGPYSSDARSFDKVKRYLEAGYAYVGVNVRGTSCSEGAYTGGGTAPFATEGRDGAEIIEWAAAQPWSTGSVGMVGISYAGEIQLATAAHRPPHLKAIVPGAVTASDYREGYMVGGMLHMGVIGAWSVGIQPGAARKAVQSRIESGDSRCASIRAAQPPNRAFWDMLEHPLRDSWWEARDPEETADRIVAPVLLVMGWQDQYSLNAGTRLFKLLKTPHKKLVLQNGGHSVLDRDINRHLEMRWLDRWVKGEKNGIDTEPMVNVHWEVTDTDDKAKAGWTSDYAAWPVPNLRWSTLYLTPEGTLDPEPPAASPDDGARSYLYPIGTELIGDNRQFSLAPYDARGEGGLSYRTAAVTADMTVLGLPQIDFFVSSDQKDTDFFFTLKDIDPDGNVLFLQRAFLRASLRAIDSGKSTPDEIIPAFSKKEELVPGRRYEIALSMPALGHVVRQGHRLELSILAPNPIPAPGLGAAPIGGPSVNKVYHSPRYPATLRLPVVPGQKAQAPPPECGILQFQPCRKARPPARSAGGS